MIQGSCLCGAVKFEISRINGPFELCHCRRCQKVTGSAFYSGIYVDKADFHLIRGEEKIRTYEAPILRSPPPYTVCFCEVCGSPVPDYKSPRQIMEIPAGLLDDDPKAKPDKHIYVDLNAAWYEIKDDLPRFDQNEIRKHREASGKR